MAVSVSELKAVVSADVGDALKKLDQVDKKIGGLPGIAKAAAVGVAALGGAIAGAAGLSAKIAIDFESAFAGVRKTVDATEEEFGVLRDGIRKMAKEVPASREAIAGVAEAAGQLGIQKSAILGFTRTMIDLGESTNLSAEEAATSLARFANITQMSQDDFGRLGSVIVDLGNNFATTEREIVEMGMRLAGAGAQIGLTEPQILAIGTALSSVGIEAEAGGTAFSRVMVSMAQQVATNGSLLSGFADVAGMSAGQFKQAFQEDAAGAISSFVMGLGRIKDSGGDVFTVLDKLELGDIRVRDALLRAAGAGDLFTRALETGSRAWEDNTALTNEAEQRYRTTASQLKILMNRVTDVGVTLGDALLPGINSVVSRLAPLIEQAGAALPGALAVAAQHAAEFGGNVKDTLGGALQWVQDRVAELGPALAGFSQWAGPFGDALGGALSGVTGAAQTLQQVLQGDLSAAFETAQGSASNFSGSLGSLRDGLTEHANLIAGVAAGYATFRAGLAITAGITALAASWGALTASVAASGGVLAGIVALLGGPVTLIVAGVAAAVGLATAAWINNWGDVQGKVAGVVAFLGTVPGQVGAFFDQLGTEAQALVQQIGPAFSALGTNVQSTLSTIGSTVGGVFSALGSTVRGALDTIGSTVGGAFSALGTTVRGAMDTIGRAISDKWNQIPEDIRADLAEVGSLLQARFAQFVTDTVAWGASTLSAIASAWASVTSAVGSAMSAVGSAIQRGWDAASTAVGTALAAIGSAIDSAWTSITSAVGTALSGILEAITGQWSEVQSATETTWSSITETIGTKAGEALTALVGKLGEMVSTVGAKASEMLTAATGIGGSIVDGIVAGIGAGFARVGEAAGNLARAALNAAKDALRTGSPSLEFYDIGTWAWQGLDLALLAGIPKVEKTTRTMADTVLDAMQGLTRDVTKLSFDTEAKFYEIGERAGRKINEEIISASRQIADAIVDADRRLSDMAESKVIDLDIRVRRDSLSALLGSEDLDRSRRREVEDIRWQRDREDLARRKTLERELSRNHSEEEKDRLRAQFAAESESLADRRAMEDEARAYRRKREDEDRQWRADQEAKRRQLEDKLDQEAFDRQVTRIEQDKTNRISAINTALDEKRKKITEDAEQERKDLLKSYAERVEDLRAQFVEKLPEALGPAEDLINGFLDRIAAKTSSTAQGLADLVGLGGGGGGGDSGGNAVVTDSGTHAAMGSDGTVYEIAKPYDQMSPDEQDDANRYARQQGFRRGGTFTVPGSGGPDTQPVGFWATPGETVSVRRPDQLGEIDYVQLGRAVAAALREVPPVVAVEDIRAGLQTVGLRNGSIFGRVSA